MNRANSRLRTALGDSAGHPRFIETLPKRGYRFIGEVSALPAVTEPGPVRTPRLAIPPFMNLTGDPPQEYFSDAMTDEIITELASLAPEQLAVIARTSAMRRKGSKDESPLMLGWLGLVLGKHATEARTVLGRLRSIANERFVLPTSFAWPHPGLGEIDDAFTWMERAADHNDEWIHPLGVYLPDGRLLYRLKHRWRDGTTHVIYEPMELIERLTALVPPPRFNITRYFGVLAPAATFRRLIVPQGEPHPATHPGCQAGLEREKSENARSKKKRALQSRNYPWAQLMIRVFSIDVYACPRCGARMRILCAINPPDAIRKILACLGLSARNPPISRTL